MERVLSSLFFLATYSILMFIQIRQQRWTLEEIRGRQRGTLVKFALGIANLVLAFVQFWLLTRVFPFNLILLLIAASLAGTALYIFVGAVAGFTLPEKQRKINVLSVIWGAQFWPRSCAFSIMGLVILAIGIIGSLWAYWSYPIGDPRTRILIVMFQFTLPQLIVAPSLILLLWPVVTSEFLDNDLRNSMLASRFSSIITSTIYLLFPVWFFQKEISSIIQPLPSIWLLLSVPLVLFLVGGVFPFFVGVYRFRSRSRVLLEWRWRWLIDVLKLVKLPEGDLRSQGLNEKFRELEAEIKSRQAENELFQFYQNLMWQDISYVDEPLSISPNQDIIVSQTAVAISQSTQLIATEGDAGTRNYIQAARNYLATPYSAGQSEEMGQQELIISIIKENKKQLINWDTRFAHIYHLLELYQVALEGKTKDISGYIETSVQEVERNIDILIDRKNVLAGSLLAIASATIVWALNAYQANIVNFIGTLVGVQ